MGALHNLSSEPGTIIVIRKARGIEQLVELLKDENPVVAGSAAGALQNVSREGNDFRYFPPSKRPPFALSDHTHTHVLYMYLYLNLVGFLEQSQAGISSRT